MLLDRYKSLAGFSIFPFGNRYVLPHSIRLRRKPPLCKGRWAKSLILAGGVVKTRRSLSQKCRFDGILPAPFTQGSLSFYRNCSRNGNLGVLQNLQCPIFLSFFKKLFTFLFSSCMITANRVEDAALSATGTGSCPEDEGDFHDGVFAPAAHIGYPPL